MDTKVVIIGILIVLAIVAGIGFVLYRKRNLEVFFTQIQQETKRFPKQKRNSFLLLMFKESLLSAKSKNKSNSSVNKLQNPKYLELQLVQMSAILRDPSKVKDKTMKKALKLLNTYHQWEKASRAKEETTDKKSDKKQK